jgi:hypothetical protein
MVYVQLAQDWTDDDGTTHSAGEMVDVDAGTLAELESAGIVASPSEGGDEPVSWPGPTATTTDTGTEAWPGPTA